MPSTFTTNLGLEKPATGEQAGNWGNTANNSYDFLDAGIDGSVPIGLSSSSYTLLTNPGAPSVARNKILIFSGALTGDCTVTIAPNTAQKIYFASNQTTGGFALVFVQGTGAPFRLLNGRSAVIYANGAGGGAGVLGALSDLQLNSLLVQTNLIIQGQIQWSGLAVFNQPVQFQGSATFQGMASFQAGMTVGVGSDQPYDLYYRSAAGPLARLQNSSLANQFLASTASGPVWATVSTGIGIGSGIAGAAPYQLLFPDSAQRLSQDANLAYTVGIGLGIGMAPARGLSIGRGLLPTIQLEAASPAVRSLVFTTNGVARWSLQVNGDAESGANIGSSFGLFGVSDDGSSALPVLAAFRNTGRAVFGAQVDNFVSQVGIYNGGSPSQNVLCVRGAPSQAGYLQVWQNNAGSIVASLDNAGNFVSAGAFLKLDSNHRLDINGAVVGHPVGTIHVGADASLQLSPSIALEQCVSVGGGLPIGAHVMRMFQRNNAFCIQFDVSGQIYYFICAFPGAAGPVTWTCATTPP